MSEQIYTESTKHLEAVSRIQSNFPRSWIGLLMNISGFTAAEQEAGSGLYQTAMGETRAQLDAPAGPDGCRARLARDGVAGRRT